MRPLAIANQDRVGDRERTGARRQTGKTTLLLVPLDDAVMTAPSDWPQLLRNTRNIGGIRAYKNHDAHQRALERLLRDLCAVGAAPMPQT